MLTWLKNNGVALMLLAFFKPWFSYPVLALAAFAAGYALGMVARLVFAALWGG